MFTLRWLVLTVIVVFLLNVFSRDEKTNADPPRGTLELPPGEIPIESNASDSDKKSRELEVLKKAIGGDQDAATNDPILAPLVEMINEGGSVLEGSSLDPRNEEAPSFHASTASKESDQKALVAESLLRSARLLRRFSGNDDARQKLVIEMRREAVKIMTEQ